VTSQLRQLPPDSDSSGESHAQRPHDYACSFKSAARAISTPHITAPPWPPTTSAASAGHPLRLTVAQAKAALAGLYDHALAVEISRGFTVSAGIMVLALLVTTVMIRATRENLASVQPMPGQGRSA
jgi:hypothetical protein